MFKKLLLMLLIFLIGCTPTLVEKVVDVEEPEVEEKVINVTEPEEEIEETRAITSLTNKIVSYKGIIVKLEGVSKKICGINVNGEVYWIEEGKIEEAGPLLIYVKEAVLSHSFGGENDACEVTLHKR